jgi:hypothetical protein
MIRHYSPPGYDGEEQFSLPFNINFWGGVLGEFMIDVFEAFNAKGININGAWMDAGWNADYDAPAYGNRTAGDREWDKTLGWWTINEKLFENGSLVYKQILGGKKIEHESQLKTELKFLDLQQWVMPAVGGNKGNEGLIKRFNTPFYPDVIVCTDVLKEGINLHLFCNRIYHYGLAWTPGDLEQRIGRIDRFFSKTHRERSNQKDLADEEKTKIEINYPYLGKSVDEHQLKQVLKFKLSADPLLDSKSADQKDIHIDIDEKSILELATLKPKDVDNCPYSGKEFFEEN